MGWGYVSLNSFSLSSPFFQCLSIFSLTYIKSDATEIPFPPLASTSLLISPSLSVCEMAPYCLVKPGYQKASLVPCVLRCGVCVCVLVSHTHTVVMLSFSDRSPSRLTRRWPSRFGTAMLLSR